MILHQINGIPASGDDIKYGDITIDKAKDEQNKLVQKVRDFKSNTKPRNPKMIKEKLDFINNAVTLVKGREMIYYGFESRIFPLPNQLIVLLNQRIQTHQKWKYQGEDSNY